VQAGSNTSSEEETKRTYCLGVLLDHPVPGGYKYVNLALQVGEFRI
jgi:hypothetical protein